tara:strand:+ start:95 stop:379 length:285 start_codon:yes stop_codon:yes gene_type:complete
MTDYYAIGAGTAGVSANVCYGVKAATAPAAQTTPVALTYAAGTCATQPAATAPANYSQNTVAGVKCTVSSTVSCNYYLGVYGTATVGTTVGTSE